MIFLYYWIKGIVTLPTTTISIFCVISIVMIHDRGHCYEHFKKNQFTMKIEWVACIWMFVYAMIFKLPEMAKNEILDFSGPTCLS